ncbi:phospholipase, putative, partial [Perkinsus marinus ATCC 50983]
SSRGIRILTLDGGGSRSLLTIAILKALTRYLPCHQIGAFFDLVVGTSAGGLVALGIGCLNLPLQMSSTVAREISVAAFSKGGALGSIEKLVRILIKGEKHDSRAMTEHLRQVYGELSMVDTTALCGSTTKVAVVTALTNVSPPEPFLFRNYTYGPDSPSRYQGDHSVAIYHCARATTAAPVYFSPVVLHDGRVIQDGALVANNPAHLALHEAARIFPGRAVDCLVSVGTGR